MITKPNPWRASLVLMLLIFLYLTVAGIYGWPGNSVIGKTLLLMGFCVIHAVRSLGVRNTAVFFVVSAVVSWAFEQVGVMTGAVYGAYSYSERLGVRLGDVPLMIPVAWFAMIYPSYVISNALCGSRIFGTKGGAVRVIWLCLVGAVVMTSWDVVMDPVMSADGFWTWEDHGSYFGVPAHNYVGWLMTTFSVYLGYRVYERRAPDRRSPEEHSLIMKLLPVAAYGIFSLYYVVAAEPTELNVIACFVMGTPVLVAAGRIIDGHSTDG